MMKKLKNKNKKVVSRNEKKVFYDTSFENSVIGKIFK